MAATTVSSPEVLGWDELEAMFGPDVVAELAGPDPYESVVSPEVDPLDVIARCERLIAMLQGEQLSAMASFMHTQTVGRAWGRESETAFASAFAEIRLVLGVAPSTSDSRVGEAVDLARRLPVTLAALCAGELTLSKAKVILEETVNLDAGQCARLEPELVALGSGRTPGNLRRMTRTRVERIDAEAVRKRTERARIERRVQLCPEGDGRYALRAYLPAEEAIAVFGVIDTLAHANRVAGDDAGIDALRADALVDLILNPGGQGSRVRYEMRVLVPFGTLLGTEDTPGHVPGQGRIPAEVTPLLAADSTWRRLLTDPDTGTALDLGADRYQPSDRLAEYIRTRDQTCRFPGCRRSAWRTYLDHTIALDFGGRHIRLNLQAACRRHHRINTYPAGPPPRTPTAP